MTWYRSPPEGVNPCCHFVDGDKVVGSGEYLVVHSPESSLSGLGSCVGIAIFDLQNQIGGLIHAMLPKYEEGRTRPRIQVR